MAKSVDPEAAEKANERITTYKRYFPDVGVCMLVLMVGCSSINKNCFEEISESYCKGKNMSYYNFDYTTIGSFMASVPTAFNCMNEDRDLEQFLFKREEIGKCYTYDLEQ